MSEIQMIGLVVDLRVSQSLSIWRMVPLCNALGVLTARSSTQLVSLANSWMGRSRILGIFQICHI